MAVLNKNTNTSCHQVTSGDTQEPHLVIAALQGNGPLPVATLTAAVTVLAEPRPDDDDDSCDRLLGNGLK